MNAIFQYQDWAIAEAYLTKYYSVVLDAMRTGHNLIHKKSSEEYTPMIESLLVASDSFPEGHYLADVSFGFNAAAGLPIASVNGKNIALIPIVGPLMKYSDLCNMGMQGFQSLLAKANNTEGIDGSVLIMDTPGGTVDGTPEFALAIKTSKKPVGVFADGTLASAGVWLASQAAVIVGNKNNPTEIGSIGVLMALPNYATMQEAGNYPKVTIYRAKQSNEKALVNAYEAPTAELEQKIVDSLSSIASDFIAVVKAGRGDKLNASAEGLFAGRMFDVQEAKKIGLIDSVGTLQTAITKVAELAKEKKKMNTLAPYGQATDNMSKPTILSNLLSGEAWKKAKAAFTEDEQATLEATETKVAEMEASFNLLKAENDQLKNQLIADAATSATQVAALEATVASGNTRIASLEQEKEALTTANAELQKKVDAKPVGHATSVVPGASEEQQVNVNVADEKPAYTTDEQAELARMNQRLNLQIK